MSFGAIVAIVIVGLCIAFGGKNIFKNNGGSGNSGSSGNSGNSSNSGGVE